MVIQLENLAGLDPECWPALVIHILQLLHDRENRRVSRLRLALPAITHLADGRFPELPDRLHHTLLQCAQGIDCHQLALTLEPSLL